MADDNQFGFYRDIQLNNGAMVVSVEGGGGGGSGTSGTSGTSGGAGTSGTNGTSGSSGGNGTSGTNGTNGSSGTNGAAGTSGTNGSSGTNGAAGSSGTSGTSGGGGGATSGSHFNYEMTSNRTYNLATGGVYEQNGLESNSIWAFPFTPGRNITISALTFDAFSGNVDGEIKLLAYSNNSTTGLPDSLIIESTAISVASGGMKQYNVSYTFSAGTTYWLAIAVNSTGNVQGRGINQYNAFPFGVPSSGGSGTIYTLARSYTLTFPTIPSTFTLNDLQGARIPEVRFIVA
jgi:hypothetical protein